MTSEEHREKVGKLFADLERHQVISLERNAWLKYAEIRWEYYIKLHIGEKE